MKWTVARHGIYMSLPYALLIDWWLYPIVDPIVDRAVRRDIAKQDLVIKAYEQRKSRKNK